MPFSQTVPIILLGIFVVSLNPLSAQDEKSPAPPKETAKTETDDKESTSEEEEKLVYADLKDEWEMTNAKFEELEQKFGAEKDAVKKAAIKTEYTDLITTSKSLGEKLRSAALSEYENKPNENEEITRLLIGMLVNDVEFARYGEAKAIADALTVGKADIKHFLALRDSTRITIGDRSIVESFIEKRQEADNPAEESTEKKSSDESKGSDSAKPAAVEDKKTE